MIQAAFFDIDGTLVSFENHAVPASAMEAINRLRASGVKTFLATGRNGDSTRFLMDSGLFDGEILLSGQLCLLNGEIVFQAPVSGADIEAAIAGAASGEFTLGFLSGHESFVSGVNEYVSAACDYAGMAIPRVADPAEARNYPVYQLHCYGPEGTEDELLKRTEGLVAVRWSRNFADVFPVGGGKDRGIEAVCHALNISPEATIAFGDGENDLSMLEYAGIGVAMGNAGDSVKARADYVTESVDAHGIARAIEHFAQLFRLNETKEGKR